MFSKVKLIWLLIAATALTISVASADTPLTSGNYTINDTVDNGGQSLTSGSYTVYDMKGQGAAGSLTSGNYTVLLGGIYGLVGGPAQIGNAPAGTVPLTITRAGDSYGSIVISWPAGANPDLYVLTGDGTGKYASGGTPAPWVLVCSNGQQQSPLPQGFGYSVDKTNTNQITVPYQVGSVTPAGGITNFPELYFKGLQNSIDPKQNSSDTNYPNQTYLQTAPAVGKVNVNLAKAGNSAWNFISTPLYGPNLDSVLGVNFTKGDQVWIWDDANQSFVKPLTFDGTTWSTANFVRGNGVLFNLISASPKTISLVGSIDLTAFTRTVAVKAGSASYGWNLIGDPFPIASAMEGLTSSVSKKGDALWSWNNVAQKFTAPLVFDGTNWPANSVMTIGQGYGYNRATQYSTGFSWSISGK